MSDQLPKRRAPIESYFGMRFGRLTVIGSAGSASDGRYVFCQCDCGEAPTVRITCLRQGSSKSCGCLNREITSAKNRTHGMTGTRPFLIWQGMLNRCTNKNAKVFKGYGGRGITISGDWLSFANFWRDMRSGYNSKLSIDRIDNDLGYSKENCRWATQITQNSNRRNSLKWEGFQSLAAMARHTGLSEMTLKHRYRRGDRGDYLMRPAFAIKKEAPSIDIREIPPS